MAIDAKQAALIAINEAIHALDFEPMHEETGADDLIEEAREALFAARSMLTGHPWPELPRVTSSEFEAWHAARAVEQKKDGRL